MFPYSLNCSLFPLPFLLPSPKPLLNSPSYTLPQPLPLPPSYTPPVTPPPTSSLPAAAPFPQRLKKPTHSPSRPSRFTARSHSQRDVRTARCKCATWHGVDLTRLGFLDRPTSPPMAKMRFALLTLLAFLPSIKAGRLTNRKEHKPCAKGGPYFCFLYGAALLAPTLDCC